MENNSYKWHGSLRMIYDGKQAYDNGTDDPLRYAMTEVRWAVKDYDLYDDNKYMGYMYGPANSSANSTTHSTSRVQAQTNTVDSNAKTQVDNWYRTNMLTNEANENKDLTPYLADAIFCNDRSLPPEGTTWWTGQDSTYSNLGWGSNHNTPYGAHSRFRMTGSTSSPTFICPNNTTISAVNDKFTVSTTSGGNGALKYPVGLISADEVVAAGGKKPNQSYYLYKSSSYYGWSLSPYILNNSCAILFAVSTSGNLGNDSVAASIGAIAPVINLKPEYAAQLQGKGTMLEPYTVPGVN